MNGKLEGKARRAPVASMQFIILMGAIALLFLLQQLLIPGSFTTGQLMLISRQASALGIIALGQALVILVGGIDLSVGSMVMMTNVFAIAWMRGADAYCFTGILGCLGLGLLVGSVNAIGVLILHIAPFVMTLCSMTIMQGICYVYTKGAPTGSAAPWLRTLGTGYLFGWLPFSTLIWLLLALGLWFVLRYTAFGRKLYAVGGNLSAAKLSGISSRWIQFSAYAFSSVMATIAGLIMSGYINTTSLSIGGDYMMNSLAAVLIGGNAINGGRGGVWGVVLGTFFIMVLFAVLTMLSIGEVGKRITQGLVIFLVVAGQSALKKT